MAFTRRTRLRVSPQASSVTPWAVQWSWKLLPPMGSGSSPGSIRTGWRLVLRKLSIARYASRGPRVVMGISESGSGIISYEDMEELIRKLEEEIATLEN